MVIVDEENRVLGVLSLSDILTFIVLKQENISQNTETSSNISLSSMNNNGGTQTPTNVHAIIEEETDLNKHAKTASLTTAFGLTRLMDNSNLMTSNDIDDSAFLQTTKQQQQQQQPILTQPTSSKNTDEIDDQSIFDDDPMEDETQHQNTTTIIS